MKSLPPQYASPRFAATPKFLKTRAVQRLVLPDRSCPVGAVDREHVGVVRRDVERAADRERVRLLAASDVGVALLEVDRVDATELVDVRRRDLGERRVALVVGRATERRASRRSAIGGAVADVETPTAAAERDGRGHAGESHASTLSNRIGQPSSPEPRAGNGSAASRRLQAARGGAARARVDDADEEQQRETCGTARATGRSATPTETVAPLRGRPERRRGAADVVLAEHEPPMTPRQARELRGSGASGRYDAHGLARRGEDPVAAVAHPEHDEPTRRSPAGPVRGAVDRGSRRR